MQCLEGPRLLALILHSQLKASVHGVTAKVVHATTAKQTDMFESAD